MRRFLLALSLLALLPLAGCAVGLDRDARFANKHRMQRALPTVVRPPADAAPDQHFLFTSFRVRRGTESNFGLFYLYSTDGLNWTPLNNDQPLFTPRAGSAQGMRDPAIAQGPDGTYHMVWTWERGSHDGIGYASSRDLIEWSRPRDLKVMAELNNDYCWAPELFWDIDNQHWLVVWSSEVKGKFDTTAHTAAHNHRLWYTTTKDFKTFAPTRLFYDPGFAAIDPAFIRLVEDGAPRYIMFFKDERRKPAKKQLRMVTGPTLYGPWENMTPALTRRNVEAPSVLRLGTDWIVYFDEYEEQRYGAIRSTDLKDWDEVSTFMSFPRAHRHGSVLEIPPATAKNLLERLGANPRAQN
jgi:hypothetical protein